MSRGSNRATLLVSTLAVLVLVGVVAVASTGSTPSGTTESRAPSEILLDTFFTLGLLALIPGAVLFVWALTQRKAVAQEMASGRYPRTSALALVVFVSLFTAAVYFIRERGGFWRWGDFGESVEIGPDGRIIVRDASSNDPDAYVAEFAWIPAFIALGLVAVAVAAFVVASRRERLRESADAGAAEELADVLDETLDDLRAEPDPRRAVIAAFARLERAFAAYGHPRFESETAEEYGARVLEGLEVDRRAVIRLTGLFTRAKFSQHEIDQRMKEDAIEALVQVRDELRVAARAVEEEAREQAETPREAAPS